MATKKVSLAEYKVICQLAKQQQCCTGKAVPIQASYRNTVLMVTAPSEFLSSLGF